MKTCLLIWGMLVSVTCLAQTYTLGWCKIAGGGGMNSTGGIYTASVTMGQPDASPRPLTGGAYSVSGGFWSVVSVVQTPGAPMLLLERDGNNLVISWTGGGFTLQQSSRLDSANWTASPWPVTTGNGTNRAAISVTAGNLFFRLKQ
jgi:hypothetical protein